MSEALYAGDVYLERNPGWHVGESPWKARQVERLLHDHGLEPRTVCEAGCGVGEVLAQLQRRLDPSCRFFGYEISPVACALAQERANERLQFKLADLRRESGARFDLLLILDVVEHVDDYLGFLRDLRPRASYTIAHIPLDLSVQTLLRSQGLLKRRDVHGHLHYFSKETALRTLEDAGYRIIDVRYTDHPVVFGGTMPQRLLKGPRRLGFALSHDWTARLLGGFSLLVLAE